MMNKLKTVSATAVLIFLAFAALYVFIPEQSSFFPITDVLSVMMGIFVVLSALLTFKLFAFSSKEGKVWLLFAAGFLIWVIGEGVWLYSTLVLQVKPALAANTIFLIGYIPIIAGFWIELNIVVTTLKIKEVIKSLMIAAVIASISTYVIILPVITSINHHLLTKLLYVFFSIADIVIIFLTLLFFFVFHGAKAAKSWLFITAAMLLGAVASIAFTYLNWNGLYAGAALMITELLWDGMYILLIVSAYHHRIMVRGIGKWMQ